MTDQLYKMDDYVVFIGETRGLAKLIVIRMANTVGELIIT